MPLNLYPLLEQPLLRTKILIPQLPPEYIHRHRLTMRIQQGARKPLVLLSTPAGYGKTNLLIEWARETDLSVAWLTIDSEDNDINRFFYYLIGALQIQMPGFGEDALDFIRPAKGRGLEVGLTLLVNELSTAQKEMWLVLDEFQELGNQTILKCVNFFLKQNLPYLHFVIASRCEPALNLTSLRAKGQLFELGAEDLRFTEDEVAQFFQQTIGLRVPPGIIQTIEQRTGGWITALQMAALSQKHQLDPATLLANIQDHSPYLIDFLAEEVLDRQSEEIRQFLLRTSILEKLTGRLCEAVAKPEAQPGYGTVMLNRLEHTNLFITALDEKHEWYHYHPLFADFLRRIQMENSPEEIPELHKRAALWLEQNGYLDEAFRHALACRDVEWAANLIERNIEMLLKRGDNSVLARWIGKLPDEIIRRRPHLSLAYTWGLIATYQLDHAQYWLEDVQCLLAEFESQTKTTRNSGEQETQEESEKVGLWSIPGGLAVCRSTLALLSGNVEQAAELSRQAIYYLQKENPFVRSWLTLDESLYFILSGDTNEAIESLRDLMRIAQQANNLLVMIIAACELAKMQALQGQLSQAWTTLQKAQYLALDPKGEPLPLAGLVDVGFGNILLERNCLDEANIYLERGCRLAWSMWPISSLDGMISLARLRQAQGDIPGAQDIIIETERMALSTDSSRWDDIVVSVVAVRLALQRNDLATAEQWWHKGHFPDLTGTITLGSYPYHILEYLLLTQARFLLVRGQNKGNSLDLQRALDLLGMLLLEAKRFRRITSQIEIMVLQAMAQFAIGNDQAIETMLHALALGEPEGYQRVYLDEGRRLSELLHLCRRAQQESDKFLPSLSFIDSLQEAVQRSEDLQQITQGSIVQQWRIPTAVKPEEFPPVYLSAREIEVLALVAEGKSNQEISAQLYLALNTVKRHIYNIYTKLEVKNRTQAVSKARQLGLIS